MKDRVFITNVFPDNNKGGAAITQETIKVVKRAFPDCAITLIATNQTDDYRESHRFTLARFPEVGIVPPLVKLRQGPMSGLRAALHALQILLRGAKTGESESPRELTRARAVISKGGYVFVDRKGPRSLLSLWSTAFPLVLAARAGVKTAVVCSTVGPYESRSSRALNRWILRQVDLVIPRDSYSDATARELGLKSVQELPDIVFGHPGVDATARAEMASRLGLLDTKFAAVTISAGNQDARFWPQLAATLKAALDEGYVDRIAVIVQSVDDTKASRAFADVLDDPRVLLIADDLSPAELIAVYGAASFVIARRMHSAIFSLLSGTPTFAFTGKAKKVQGVMESLALGEHVMQYPDFDRDALLSKLRAAVSDDADTLRSRILSAVQTARSKLESLPKLLAQLAPETGKPLRDEPVAAAEPWRHR